MKKTLPIFFIYLLFLQFCFPRRAISLETDDYISSTFKYKKDYESFILARSRYLTYKSIWAELEAIESARKMILSKVELLQMYLNLVRNKFAQETGIKDYKENLVFVQLDIQTTDISELKDKIVSAKTLLELDQIEKDFSQKYDSSTKLSFKALGLIKIKKFSSFLDSFLNQLNLLEEKIGEIGNSTDYDTAPLLRRIDEIEKKLESSKNKFNSDSKAFLEKVSSSDPKQTFVSLGNSLSDLKREIVPLFSLLEEIFHLIKKITENK